MMGLITIDKFFTVGCFVITISALQRENLNNCTETKTPDLEIVGIVNCSDGAEQDMLLDGDETEKRKDDLLNKDNFRPDIKEQDPKALKKQRLRTKQRKRNKLKRRKGKGGRRRKLRRRKRRRRKHLREEELFEGEAEQKKKERLRRRRRLYEEQKEFQRCEFENISCLHYGIWGEKINFLTTGGTFSLP